MNMEPHLRDELSLQLPKNKYDVGSVAHARFGTCLSATITEIETEKKYLICFLCQNKNRIQLLTFFTFFGSFLSMRASHQ